MSQSKVSSVPDTDSNTSESEPETHSPEVVLEPHLSPRFALCLHHVGLFAVFAVFFLVINLLPLHFSDIWGHVTYGEYILKHHELPTEDPVVPLTHGVPVAHTAWLSQVIFASIVQVAEPVGLTSLFALTVLASYLLIFGMGRVQTGRWDLALLGTIVALVLGANRLLVIRPEIFGMLSLAAVMFLVAFADRAGERENTAEKPGNLRFWILAGLMPLIFCFWANAHGSFPVGLLVLGCQFLGRSIEVAWKERHLKAILTDRWTWRWLVLTELALAGTLINPQGIDLLIYVASFGQNPNLENILEWQPLQIGVLGWQQFAASWAVLFALVRLSPRRFSMAQILLLAVFTALVFKTSRMINWYAVIYTYCVLPHIQAVLAQWVPQLAKPTSHPGELRETLYGPTFKHTAVCLLIVWLAFAVSPMATPVLGGGPVPPERLYHERTPRGVTAYFREHPPQGQLYNPQWWGDWLAWDGPENLKPFMTTNAIHLAPRQLWQDYETISAAEPAWMSLLRKYDVETIVLEKSSQAVLVSRVRGLSDWEVSYEDELAVVFTHNPQAAPADEDEEDSEDATPADASR